MKTIKLTESELKEVITKIVMENLQDAMKNLDTAIAGFARK